MKSSEYDKISVSYFYKLYEKKNIRHRVNTYDKESNRNGRRIIPAILFRKIIYTYLKLFFFEFYSMNAPSYFPWGGYIKKVASNKAVRDTNRNGNKKRIVKNRTISWFWFLRPNMRMGYMIKLTKMTGSTNIIPKIEAWYRTNFDIDKLPTFNEERIKKKRNKTIIK